MKTKLFGLIALVLMLAGFLAPAAKPANACLPWPPHPVIFVHGGAGSGMQFESQAMRFAENFYPHDYIYALEYDSRFTVDTLPGVWNRLDALIATAKAEHNADQVDLLGHSLGTMVSQMYLNSSAERASNVAHYVNIDGGTASALPGTVVGVPVPTLALWAGKTSPLPREIVGATNVTLANQTHVQAATSAEAFVEMYKFFTGFPPLFTFIFPQFFGPIELAGRAVIFPQNIGVDGATLEIWKVNPRTGARIGSTPKAVYALDETGDWGPFRARMGQSYEFNIVREGESPHPFYFEPFIRSDYLMRLNTSVEPGGGTSALMDRSPNHTNLIIGRNNEIWGDQAESADNDELEVNGVNLVNADIFKSTPFPAIKLFAFVYDKDSDGVSHLDTAIPDYAALTFFTGIDDYIPGAYPPDGTVHITLRSRGSDKTQRINVPNLASSEVRRITVTFNDWVPIW